LLKVVGAQGAICQQQLMLSVLHCCLASVVQFLLHSPLVVVACIKLLLLARLECCSTLAGVDAQFHCIWGLYPSTFCTVHRSLRCVLSYYSGRLGPATIRWPFPQARFWAWQSLFQEGRWTAINASSAVTCGISLCSCTPSLVIRNIAGASKHVLL
ncbi:hypothetical protein COO60DRAFT_1484908, partial [Scenedesmus sp. NREL 46B-D3]